MAIFFFKLPLYVDLLFREFLPSFNLYLLAHFNAADKMTPSPVTSQATTQSSNQNRGPATPQTPGSHNSQKGTTDRPQHPSTLPQAPGAGNTDTTAPDLESDNLPDEFNFDVLESDHGGGTDGVEGALDVSCLFV